MKYSNKIDVQKFFKNAKEQYCIIKLSDDFPNYCTYSDIDVFCYDIKAFSREIFDFAESYINNGWEIKTSSISDEHIQIDFYEKGAKRLDFRFDLHSALPKFSKVQINEGLFTRIIENAQKNDFGVFIPCRVDDFIIRYLEFVEYYDIRADKIKHADYILKNITEDEKELFFKKLHYYTKLPLEVCEEYPMKKKLGTTASGVFKVIVKPFIVAICWFIPFKNLRHRLRRIYQ